MTAETVPCEFHHATDAVARCRECQVATCQVCTTLVNTAPYCPSCRLGRADQHAWLAAILSLFVPGLGQVYNGQWGKAVAAFVLAPLVLPWIWGIYDAVNDATEIRAGRREARTVPTGWVLIAVKVLFLPLAGLYVLWVLLVVGIVAALLNLGTH